MENRKRSSLNFGLFLLLLLIFCTPNLYAQPFTLNVIADLETPIPGGVGNFDDFDNVGQADLIALDLPTDEAFVGFGPAPQGLYASIGGSLVLIVDQATPIPGGSGNFAGFNNPVSLGGGNVAFIGTGPGQEGIYTFISGMLSVEADLNTIIPGSADTFTGFNDPVSLGSGDYAFRGSGSTQEGIYRSTGGMLSVVVDTSTPIPGGTGTFTDFSDPVSLGGGDFIFVGFGSSGQTGIYAVVSGMLSVVADTGTVIPPGGSGNFTDFNDLVSLGSGNFAFRGSGSGLEGIYRSIGGMLSAVADTGTAIPLGSGNFTELFVPVSLGGGNLAFRATGGSGQQGIYSTLGGMLSAVADTSTMIPGSGVNFTNFFNPTSSANGDVAFFGAGPGAGGFYLSIGVMPLLIVVDRNTLIPGGSGNFFTFSDAISFGSSDVAFRGGRPGQDGIYTFISSTLSVLVDRSDLIPGGGGNFLSFDDPVSLGGSDFAFRGFGSDQIGVYTSIGGVLLVVADTSSMAPGVASFVSFFDLVSLGSGDVAFSAGNVAQIGGGQVGIYRSIGNVLSTVVDTNTPIPGGSGDFEFLQPPTSIGGDEVAFRGSLSGDQGIYKSMGGMLVVVADENTPVPGGTGDFTDLNDPVSSGTGEVLFTGSGGGLSGIFVSIGSALSAVVDTNTMIPGTGVTFGSFMNPVPLGGSDVAFLSTGAGEQGIYTSIGGSISTIADRDTMIPGGSGDFNLFNKPVSLEAGDVAFRGGGTSGQEGIYKSIGGALSLVADLDTMIPDGTGDFTGFSDPISLGNGEVAFRGTGSSGQQGVYATLGGALLVVADLNTMIPGGTGTFTEIFEPVSSGNGDVAFRATGTGQHGLYSALSESGSITIVKESNPNGETGFEFTGTGFPGTCALDGTFTLDDDEFLECNLVIGSYTVQETNSQGFDISNIDCVGASDFTSTADSVTVNLMTDEIVVCTFTNTNEVNLNLSIAGNGTGTVDINPPGETCEPDCMQTYVFGTNITLTPNPGMFSIFEGITGDADCGENITITSNLNCTATFTLMQFLLSVTTSGTGGGTVTGPPGTGGGIVCGEGNTDCDELYDATTMVTLTATPDGDSVFGGWTGACTGAGTNMTATVNMLSALSCNAEFTPRQLDVTVNIVGPGSGTVTSAPPGINCPGDCTETYDIHTAVTLTDVPDPVSMPAVWSPNCAGGVIADLTQDTVCTATFNFIPLILNQIFPGLANNINQISVAQASPNGNVAFIWGFQPGSTTIGGPTCNGLQLDIQNPRLLSIVRAGADQIANYTFFIPNFGDSELPILTQAVDVPTCRKSGVENNTIRKD